MTYESPPPNAERIDVGENVEPSEVNAPMLYAPQLRSDFS